jgi:hypothetical protein
VLVCAVAYFPLPLEETRFVLVCVVAYFPLPLEETRFVLVCAVAYFPLPLEGTRQALHSNVTLRRVRVTIVAVGKQAVLHVVSVYL